MEVGADYLSRTNPYNDAPALEHAYAVTTYSAQGATVDRAFVMADPSMDKQELYVAASRAREETHLYATPEIEVHREEIAPASPYLREGIPHIAEASERDRAQLAAHDQALASKFSGLPTEELAARRAELIPAAQREQEAERSHERLQREIARARESIERFEAQRTEALLAPKREQRHELGFIEAALANNREALERLEARAQGTPAVQHTARRELALAEQVLDERLRSGGPRRPPLTARLHRQGAGGEAERPGASQKLGSRRGVDRGLPPGAPGHRPRQRLGRRAPKRLRARQPRAPAAPAGGGPSRAGPRQHLAHTIELGHSIGM